MRAASLVLAAAIAGCSSTPPLEIPREIAVPAPIPCISPASRAQRPALRTQAEIARLDTYRATHALWASYARALAYIGELEAAVEGCSKIPAAAGSGQ